MPTTLEPYPAVASEVSPYVVNQLGTFIPTPSGLIEFTAAQSFDPQPTPAYPSGFYSGQCTTFGSSINTGVPYSVLVEDCLKIATKALSEYRLTTVGPGNFVAKKALDAIQAKLEG